MSELLDNAKPAVGVVAIGRNEGERLKRCLRSVVDAADAVVYVDSGSTDGSVAFAESLGVHVIDLDMSQPFTMARGRNAGYRWLRAHRPELNYTQFLDGDCEVVDGWLAAGAAALDADDELAAVSGRRREKHPEASVYNALADLEWDTPVGRVQSFHGDVMLRNRAVDAVGLFNETLICGEEPELAVRLRRAGWHAERLDREMTRHDAAMTSWRQWWKRSVRGGWAYAEGAAMHGKPPERHNVRQRDSVLFFGLGYPLALLALAWPTWGLSLLGLIVYPVLGAKVYRWARETRGWSARQARPYAASVVLGKFPQAVGMLKYYWGRVRGKTPTLIEYKTGSDAADNGGGGVAASCDAAPAQASAADRAGAEAVRA